MRDTVVTYVTCGVVSLLVVGHCKSILPIWNKLGKKYKDSEAVDVAKMDGTENELEDVALKGFPTIKLYRKETNEILDYSSRKYTRLATVVFSAHVMNDQAQAEPELEVELSCRTNLSRPPFFISLLRTKSELARLEVDVRRRRRVCPGSRVRPRHFEEICNFAE